MCVWVYMLVGPAWFSKYKKRRHEKAIKYTQSRGLSWALKERLLHEQVNATHIGR